MINLCRLHYASFGRSFAGFLCCHLLALRGFWTFAISVILQASKWLRGSSLSPAKAVILTGESGDITNPKRKAK